MLNVDTPVVQIGSMYLNRGLDQAYSRPGEFLSYSQIVRRIHANTIDSTEVMTILDLVRHCSGLQKRKHELDRQSFQLVKGKRNGTLELKCFDLSSISAIREPARYYAMLRLRVHDALIRNVLDVH